jgi:hypothetical protein
MLRALQRCFPQSLLESLAQKQEARPVLALAGAKFEKMRELLVLKTTADARIVRPLCFRFSPLGSISGESIVFAQAANTVLEPRNNSSG